MCCWQLRVSSQQLIVCVKVAGNDNKPVRLVCVLVVSRLFVCFCGNAGNEPKRILVMHHFSMVIDNGDDFEGAQWLVLYRGFQFLSIKPHSF